VSLYLNGWRQGIEFFVVWRVNASQKGFPLSPSTTTSLIPIAKDSHDMAKRIDTVYGYSCSGCDYNKKECPGCGIFNGILDL
jgi:hypothetical protein